MIKTTIKCIISKSVVFLCILLSFMTSMGFTEKLVVVSPHNEGHRREMGKAFEAYYLSQYKTPITIEWLDQGGGSDVLRYVKSEFTNKPNGINVDIFYGGGVDPYYELAKLNLLQPYKINPVNLKNIPQELNGVPLYDKQYRWYGTALSGFGILNNDMVIKRMRLPFATAWSDMTNYRLNGWIGSADPRHSGSVHMMYEIILQAYGWEKGWDIITKMGGNIKAFTQTAASTPQEVKIGNVAYGLCIDVYAWSQIAEVGAGKMSFVLPGGVSVISPDAVAILKGAPNQRASKAFLDFLTSEKAQKILMLPPKSKEGPQEFGLYRMSISPKIYDQLGARSNIRLSPFKMSKSFKYDAAKGSLRYGIVNDLIGAMIIDSHQELKTAWKNLNTSKVPAAATQNFSKPPITEQQAMAYAAVWQSNTEQRNRLIAQWSQFARKKYTDVAK